MRNWLSVDIVPFMGVRQIREITSQDVQGVKYLRRIRPLLSRLHAVGTKRDRAASVIIDVGWKSRQRTRPDHPVRLVTNLLEVPA